MAAVVLVGVQVAVGLFGVSPWFGDGDVVDVVAFLILGVSALAGVPGSVLTGVAARRRAAAPARAALGWTSVRAVLLVAVTAGIVAVTEPGPGGEWVIDGEVVALAALEIAVSYALAHDTARRTAPRPDQRRVPDQRRTQV